MFLDNDGKHIHHILTTTDCPDHMRNIGDPCWYIMNGISWGYGSAVCGSRIRAAGYNGEITPTSIQLKAPKARTGFGRRR